MDKAFVPQWFATPDLGTLYAMTDPDRVVEHQRIGRRYRRHLLEIKTYADRLHAQALLDRAESGALVSMGLDAYEQAVKNMERLEPMP